jgi:hypothetical protein
MPSAIDLFNMARRTQKKIAPIFPDAVVFLAELQWVDLALKEISKDILEIWVAQAVLQFNSPGIAKVPKQLKKKISKLPTEQNRIKSVGSVLPVKLRNFS